MKAWPIFRTIFTVIGMVTTFVVLVLIILSVYIVKTKSFDVSAVPFVLMNVVTNGRNDTATTPGATYDHPLLSPVQEQAAQSFGIDPRSIPTQITKTQESCAVTVLGQRRVDEIKAGALPSMAEVLKAKQCFQ